MKQVSRETWIKIRTMIVRSFLLSIIFWAIIYFLLRFLGPIISVFEGNGGKIAAVFGQLRTAKIMPPIFLTWATWFLFYALRDKICTKIYTKRCTKTDTNSDTESDTKKCTKLPQKSAGCIIITVVFGILLFVVTLLLTSVNEILFGNVLRSLLKLIANGLLQKL